MRRHILTAVLLLGALCSVAFAKSSGVLVPGSRDGMVYVLQEWLNEAGFPAKGDAAGVFGPRTEEAVRAFQHQAGLKVDGLVGSATWCSLGQAALGKGKDALAGRGLSTPMIAWETVNQIWPRGSTGWLMDLEKRTVIKVIRNGGYWHADVEPATANDTAVFRSWYGRWAWTGGR